MPWGQRQSRSNCYLFELVTNYHCRDSVLSQCCFSARRLTSCDYQRFLMALTQKSNYCKHHEQTPQVCIHYVAEHVLCLGWRWRVVSQGRATSGLSEPLQVRAFRSSTRHKPFPCTEVSGAAYPEEAEQLNCFCQANPCVQDRDRLTPVPCSPLPSLISAMDCICLVSC